MKRYCLTHCLRRLLPIVIGLQFVLLTNGRPVQAQESTFGLQFLGTSEETSDARARGLGVLGIALDERRSAITQNPATLAQLDFMTLSAMFVTGSRTTRSETAEEDRAVARFPHARAALPMFNRFVLSAGFNGFRNFKSKINLPEQQIDGFAYSQNFVRDGTIFTFPIGLSASLTKRLHVGATYDFVLGTVDESWETRGDSLVSLATRRRGELNGRTFTLGALVQPWSWLDLGAAWSPQFVGNGSTRWTLEDVRILTNTTPIRDFAEQGDILFPQSWKLGASVQLHRKLLLTTDFLWREWTVYDGNLFEAEGVEDEWRFGAGLEWQRDGRIDLRGGFSHQKWPQIVGGHELKETTIHLGTGFDLSETQSRIDLAVEYAMIGDIEKNLLEERVIRFVLSISGQEKWERRRPAAED